MKRELKFRAWNKLKRLMSDPFGVMQQPSRAKNKALGIVLKEDLIILQFTGLTDKNEKDIYEGDILAFTVFDCFDNDTQHKGCVVFGCGEWQIWPNPNSEFWGSDGASHLAWTHGQDCEIEIIGNIYENPELLETP